MNAAYPNKERTNSNICHYLVSVMSQPTYGDPPDHPLSNRALPRVVLTFLSFRSSVYTSSWPMGDFFSTCLPYNIIVSSIQPLISFHHLSQTVRVFRTKIILVSMSMPFAQNTCILVNHGVGLHWIRIVSTGCNANTSIFFLSGFPIAHCCTCDVSFFPAFTLMHAINVVPIITPLYSKQSLIEYWAFSFSPLTP